MRRKGFDPIDERRRERAENLARSRATPPTTFKQMTAEYLRAHGDGWKHKYARAVWLNPLIKYAFPIIGDLPLDQIELSHVLAVMDAAEQAGFQMTARRIKENIARVINAAMAKGRCNAERRNPADAKLIAAARPSKRKGERPHYRAVDLNDAPKVFQMLKARAETHTAFAAWVFMILTAARPSEALNAQLSELDHDQKLWVLPPTRAKSSKQHIVPLSTAALEILERQARVRRRRRGLPRRGRQPIELQLFRHRAS